MNVYRLWRSPRFHSLWLLDDNPNDIVKGLWNQLNSTGPLRDKWSPVRVAPEPYEDERRIPRPAGDCAYFIATGQAFSRNACDALIDLVEPYGEFLPLQVVPAHDDLEYYLPHIWHELEALDLERSTVDRFEGRVSSIDQHVFFPEVIGDAPVFRMPHNPRHAIYVTEPFVHRVQERGLTGFRFPLLWSDDPAVLAERERKRAESLEQGRRARVQAPVKEKRLTRSDRRKMEAAIDDARVFLEVQSHEPAEAVQKRIYDTIGAVRQSRNVSSAERKQLSTLLGSLWGQTIRDLIQWEWTKVEFEKVNYWAIVPSDRAYMLLPVRFISELLEDPQSENTSLATFKYLRSNELKPGNPGQYLQFRVGYIVPPE